MGPRLRGGDAQESMVLKLTHAIILAAGLGTRMRPLTDTLPKPLIAVQGKALIDWCLEWLAQAGIAQVVVNSSYLAGKLEAHLEQEKALSVRVSREPSPPLETGGGIAKALPMLGDGPFLAMNSDAIFVSNGGASSEPSPLAWRVREGEGMFVHPVVRLCEAWRDGLDFVMLLVRVENAIGWEKTGGDFVMDDAGRIRRPRAGEDAPYIFTGVEIMHPRVFAGCPQGAFSLSRLWNARVDADGWFTGIRAIVHAGVWLNVGDLAGLAAAEAYCAMVTGNCT